MNKREGTMTPEFKYRKHKFDEGEPLSPGGKRFMKSYLRQIPLPEKPSMSP